MTTCGCCQQQQLRLYCAPCLVDGVNTHGKWANSVQSQSTAAILRSTQLQDKTAAWRELRAGVNAQKNKCSQLRQNIEMMEAQIHKDVVASRRVAPSNFDGRQRTALAIRQVHREQLEVDGRIIHARQVLVREAIQLFGLETMTIAGIGWGQGNAALLHVIHLASLLTVYLSIALPYTPFFPDLNHVGRPSLRANSPYLNTAKYRDKHVLWMPSSTRSERSRLKYRNFMVAYGLLCHSLAYLAWSQGVEGIGIRGEGVEDDDVLISATEPLRLLKALGESERLGERFHGPGGSLRHLGFSLDVTRVVGALVADEADLGEDWDMVNALTIN